MISADLRQLQQEHPEYVSGAARHHWRNFVLMALDTAFFSFAVGMLSQDTILPYFASQLTDAPAVIALIPAIYYAGMFLPQVLGAYLTHGAASRKSLIFWIAVSERVGMLLIALAANMVATVSQQGVLLTLLIGYALFAGTNGLIGPAYGDFISKAILRRRGLFYGVTHGIGNLSGFLAGLCATFLLARYDYPVSLQLLFWGGFCFSFVSPLFIAGLREVPFPVRHERRGFITFLKGIPADLARVPALRRYLLLRMLLSLGIVGNSFYALYALERHGADESFVGRFTLVILLSQSLLGLVWGWWGDRRGYKALYTLCGALFAAAGFLALAAGGADILLIIAVGVGGYYALTKTADPNMVMELAPIGETGKYIGIINTILAPGLIISAIGGGVIVQSWGYQSLFTVVLLIGIVATAGTAYLLPDPRRPN